MGEPSVIFYTSQQFCLLHFTTMYDSVPYKFPGRVTKGPLKS
jgi:hypothetical protein